MKKILSFTLAVILVFLRLALSASAKENRYYDITRYASTAAASAATPDEITPDNTPEEQFKHFLNYELEEARKSGKSDQELIDEKAMELGLSPYQVYYILENLHMRDSVRWDFKLWLGTVPTFKGQCFTFGLNGFMPEIPGKITGYVTYDARGLALEEGLKDYPFSGLNFPLATEEYNYLYDVEYSFSAGRVDFCYTLKDQKAAEEFFGISGAATADEAQAVRIRLLFVTGIEKVVAEEGRYNNAECAVEVQDTKGNWLYKDHQSTVPGYGVQGMFPMPFMPLPEDYNGYVPEYILGDADSDGVVSVLDATTIQKYKATLISKDKIDLNAADSDQDGLVTVLDATRIQKFKAKICNLDGSELYKDEI